MIHPLLKTIKSIPFARLVVALVCGIQLQWYLQFNCISIISVFAVSLLLLFAFTFLPLERKYSLRWSSGMLILLLTASTGAYITWQRDIRHHPQWAGNFLTQNQSLLVTLQEPLVTKPNSYKVLASIDALSDSHQWKPLKGNVLIYLKKDSLAPALKYGSQIVIHKTLQPITNSGNPGTFDYKRYCLFQDISYQVFLQSKDYSVVYYDNGNWFQYFLFTIRDKVISLLKEYIPGDKEQGVAEALLIGYRNDLDKELVQAYSNTGVVHIIAISGLHLGLIYGLLRGIFNRVKSNRFTRVLKPIVILLVIWLFTFLAGAVPSILRSAVMFTFIIMGETFNRRTNIYNTLAASAFCLLIWNPFNLWDVGFQLSYAAVLSIVIFMRPIYSLLYFKNKFLKNGWELMAATFAAQILTLPLVIYTFHQLPLLFFITNLVAVPVSTFILYGELALVALCFIKPLCILLGYFLFGCIWFMDKSIELVNSIPFSVWINLQLSVLQAMLLFIIIVTFAISLLQKNKLSLFVSLTITAIFFIVRSVDFINKNNQHKLIVYNVPKYAAADIIEGRKYTFIGDSILTQDDFLQNFHLKPSRILYRVGFDKYYSEAHFASVGNKYIAIITDKSAITVSSNKTNVDILILSHNPKVYIAQLQQAFNFKQLVFDSSNPLWKIEKWKKDCENLHLRFHSVPGEGAFIMDL